ncbi:hypothetical protein DOY81_005190 [Sarcophaga bullata]|nr:hypothetical protein DOY81_005190 [Sarcophaga bullata]
MSFTDHDVAEVRHVVQRILVPCVFVIGLLGNSVSIYVLTRRRMRCTTNIYLTALAITDIIYLTMALLLSLQHYQYVHLYCEIYWMCYGVIVWLCDACCVTLFCLFSTISTAFEHQHSIEYRMMDNLGQPCNQTVAKAYAIQRLRQQQYKNQQQQHEHEMPLNVMENNVEFHDDGLEGSGGHNEREFILSHNMHALQNLNALTDGRGEEDETVIGKKIKRSGVLSYEKSLQALTSTTLTNIPTHLPTMLIASSSLSSSTPYPWPSEALLMVTTEFERHEDVVDNTNLMTTLTNSRPVLPVLQRMALNQWENVSNIELLMDDGIYVNITDFCENVTYYNHQPTALGNDDFYINVWYFVTLCVFVLIPLCVLVTFNCFLIMLVRRSTTIRGEMTNASSIRRPKRKSTTTTVSQENRVTITLIAVVLLFIVCQLPWAVYLIVSCQIDIESHLQSIFGNIFNFLAATNAAANFFLYCVLSDKYRKTIREMITGYRYKQQRNTLTTTSLYTNGSRRSYRTAGGLTSLVIK